MISAEEMLSYAIYKQSDMFYSMYWFIKRTTKALSIQSARICSLLYVHVAR